MRRSKSAKLSHNPNITVRRSERLADNFKKLPDDLIIKILFKIQDDTKTLIRCSTVCKNLHSLVSKIDTVSLKFLCPNEGDDDDDVLLCSQSHHHIPQVAFPALMKRTFYTVGAEVQKQVLCPEGFSQRLIQSPLKIGSRLNMLFRLVPPS
nr:uncharacterized protein LOC118056958 isoform X2 [Populus alba]